MDEDDNANIYFSGLLEGVYVPIASAKHDGYYHCYPGGAGSR